MNSKGEENLYGYDPALKGTVGGRYGMDEAQRILVVDDEPGPREALRMILDPQYQVVTATDGPEALQLIHTTPPDLVFLDIRMPGMDGIEVLKAVKDVDSRIEAIIMTGHASLETARGAMAYGASEYLIKPFSEDEVDEAVKKALARRAERMGEHQQVRILLEHLRGLHAEIKETKSYLENLINSAGDAIITVNQEDVVTAWNQSAERIFLYRAEEVLHQDIGILFPAALYEPWRDAVLQQGNTKRVETQLKRRDGTAVYVSLTLSPLLNSRDEIAGCSAILRDVTEDRQLREQLAQSEKLSALGEMAAGIAHNLNNILAAIMGRAQLLINSPPDADTLQRGVATIQRAVEDGATMVQRIQRFARGDLGSEFRLTDLNQLIQETVEATQLIWEDRVLQKGGAIEVAIELGTLPPIRSRPAELREVLINLILNAVDAMPAGGRLTVRTMERGKVACIEIADTGTGMTEEVKLRAFNPFFTTKGAKGTGLGLSISHALIKGQHGEIELQSELGKGTTFVITLPMP